MATTTPTPSPKAPSPSSSPFPFATAPDIIRAHQKDAYFQGVLTNHLTDLHRRLLGARSSHAWAIESRTLADLLYLSLTTLLGNRTLGEEYCDLIQVEAPEPPPFSSASPQAPDAGPKLPSLRRRSAYITLSILLPYALSHALPPLRARLRNLLESRLAAHHHTRSQKTTIYRVQRYLLAYLNPLTSGAHLHALVLASFYFSGAYYSLAKRATRLRYVFTRRLPEAAAGGGDNGRGGYEVLGVLLVVQLAVQGYLHIRRTLRDGAGDEQEVGVEAAIRERAWGAGGGEVSLDHAFSYGSGNNDLLPPASAAVASGRNSKAAIGRMAHTPVASGEAAVFDLRDDKILGWIKGRSQRKCTLCLDELRDPSATGCGHVFCWSCIGDWVREKPECPLCRREVMIQHILPLRVV